MKHTILLAASLLTLGAQHGHAQIVINEVMQSNIDCTMDDLNEFPDSWVELYNPTTEAVSLGQYAVGTKADGSDAWTLPQQTLGPHQYELVYCDKEATGLHTTFRLESGKNCKVYLFKTDGTQVDNVTIAKKQPAPNIAYGRKTDGAEEWGYQYRATPRAMNCGEICTEILGEPVFSEQGRVMTSQQSIQLTLSLPDDAPQGTEIRYTTDGSEPTTASTLYSKPISISSNRTVRAKLFCPGWLSPRSTTHSYLYLGREMTLPVVSIVTNSKYLNDPKIGIYVAGSYSSAKKNYEYNWRRPISFEYFEEAGSPSTLSQLCETRIQGGATRSNKLKSLALYANKRFGTKRFEHEFFPDQRPGQTNYKSILMRNAGNDFDYLYMRDAIMQRTMASHVDLDWQAWRPVIIYINGTYKGILNIRERSNEDNIYTNYDELEDIDMVENWEELKTGTWDNYNAFAEFYNEHGHTWDEYSELMDLNEYLNLMVMNLYYNNQDFPGNNFVMWRPTAEDGRWRFIAKDTDFGLGLYGSSYSYQTLKWLYDPNYDYNRNWANQYDDTRLFRRLMEDEDFKREFIDRSAIYMGDFLNYDGTWATWEPMYNMVKTEYPHHRKLINEWWPNYSDEVNSAKNWVRNRTNSYYTQIGSYYSLGTAFACTINKDMAEEERQEIEVTFNGIPLSTARFDGKFYPNREVTLAGSPALDADGLPRTTRTVTGWTITTTGSSGQKTEQVEGSVCHFTTPSSCTRITITALLGESQGLEEVRDDVTSGQIVEIYDLKGICRPELQPGVNIVKYADGTVRRLIAPTK